MSKNSFFLLSSIDSVILYNNIDNIKLFIMKNKIY